MTTPAPRSPAPTASPPAPYVPAWALYLYEGRAFLTWDGRLVAHVAVAMPAQEARIEGVFDRLTHGHAPHTSHAGPRRPRASHLTEDNDRPSDRGLAGVRTDAGEASHPLNQ